MNLREELLRQKLEGEREWTEKQEEERRQKAEEEARVRAEEESRRAAESERDRKKAVAVYASLPDAVREAASRGLSHAILADSFVAEKPEADKPARPLTVDRKTFFLTGWQIPFAELCQADSVPLTVVSERVDVALKGVLHKTFHLLAIDLKRL